MQTPRFENVSCSQCGGTFGPGEHGFSHCDNHQGMSMQTNDSGHVAGGKTEADTRAHTATPWEVVDARICKDGYLLATCWAVIPVDVQQDGESWRDMQERIEPQRDASQAELLARAAFIGRACNAHDDLVAALESALRTSEVEKHAPRSWHAAARAAIAKSMGAK